MSSMATIWRGAKQGRLEPALLAFALGAAGLLAAPSAHAQQPQLHMAPDSASLEKNSTQHVFF